MKSGLQPRIISEKHTTPTIYLDSCAIIELARYEKGNCTNAHKKEIGDLFDLLSFKIQDGQVMCPCGNQLVEVGMTARREHARNFLFRFTNADFQHPDCVCTNQMNVGFRAFINQEETIALGVDSVYKEVQHQSPFKIHAAPIYTEERTRDLSREKQNVAEILNEMKKDGRIREDFASQLTAELESEYISFVTNVINNPISSEDACRRYVEEIERFYRTTGQRVDCGVEEHTQTVLHYCMFLLSPYHDLLPYIWIRANLWTQLMQRQKHIINSDNLDVQWASAYLPYIDYALTDKDFCERLQASGLAEQYKVKVYSLSTLQGLIDDLENMVSA